MFNNKRIKALEQKIEDLENTIHDLELALNRESMAYYNRAFEVECEKARTKALNTIMAGKIEWHEQTFPDATLDGQLQKLADEYKEYYEADKKDAYGKAALMELADLVIVACGIARFNLVQGLDAFDDALHIINQASCFCVKEVNEAVQEKMQINRKRKWNKIGNKFQHIEEGSEE